MATKRRDAGDGALFWSEAKQRYIARVVLSDGRRVTRQRKTRTEANRVLQQMRLGRVQPRVSRERTGDYLTRWLDEQVQLGRYRPNTVRTYRSLIPVIADGIGHHPLDRLSARQVQTFIARATQEYKPASVGSMRALLSKALGDALRLGLIQQNPILATTAPRIERSDRTAPDAAAVTALIEHFSPPYHAAVAIAAHLGLRQSEVLGLRWQDVTETALTVAGQLDRDGTWIANRKGGGSLTLPLLGVIARALSRQRAYQAEQRLKARACPNGGNTIPGGRTNVFIFTNDDGTPIRQWQLSAAFGQTARASGLPFKSFHDLRHATVSLLLSIGCPPQVVAQIVGHASTRQTLQYAHTNAAEVREWTQRLERTLGG